MSDRAVIQADLEGDLKIKQKAKGIQEALKSAGTEGKGKIEEAATSAQKLSGKVDALASSLQPQSLLGSAIGGAALASVAAIGSYMEAAGKATIDYGEASSATARRTGLDLGSLRSQFDRTELATGQAAGAQMDFIRALGSVTGQSQGAANSLDGIARRASAAGRELSSFVAVTATLQDLGFLGDVNGELDRLDATARRLSTVGGPAKFQETLAALRPVFNQVNTDAAGAAEKLTALTALASKNYKPDQARGVVASSINLIESMAVPIKRLTGKDVRDDKGNIADPIGALRMIRDQALKQNGGNRELALLGLERKTDARTARFLLSKEFDQVEGEAKNQERQSAQAGLDKFLASPEGQRQGRKAEKEVLSRGETIGQAAADTEDLFQRAEVSALRTVNSLGEKEEEQVVSTGRPAWDAPPAKQQGPAGWNPDEVAKKFGDHVLLGLRSAPLVVRQAPPPPEQ